MTEKKKDARKDVLLRLRRIEGQVRGVQRMLEEEANCAEILNQVAAVKSAINQVGILVFENHARECIFQILNEGENGENLKEIVDLMGKLVK